MQFSATQRLFLRTIGSYFHEHAEWPTYGYLDRALRDHEDLEVEIIGQELEPFMYDGPFAPMFGYDPTRTTFLCITAIYTCVSQGVCPELAEDLDTFMEVVRLCIAKYLTGNDDKEQITSEEVHERFGVNDLMLRKVFDMVSRANLTDGSGANMSDISVQWSFTIWQSAIRKYRKVETIDDFISVRESLVQRDKAQTTAGPVNLLPGLEDQYPVSGLRNLPLETGEARPVLVPNDVQMVQIQPIRWFPHGPFVRNDNLCFVIMPFKEALQPVFDDAIVLAANDLGLECERADDTTEPGIIMAQVWESLMKARLVVADLTDGNANVFYELGLAHTIGHNVVMLTQDLKWVPFDLRHMRCEVYQPDAHGLRVLSQRLRKVFKEILAETVVTKP